MRFYRTGLVVTILEKIIELIDENHWLFFGFVSIPANDKIKIGIHFTELSGKIWWFSFRFVTIDDAAENRLLRFYRRFCRSFLFEFWSWYCANMLPKRGT